MNIEAMKRRMATTKTKRCVIDTSEDAAFPGFIRTIYIQRESVVFIEYEQCGHDEGGAYFFAAYPSLNDAVSALEMFLGTPHDAWPDSPPDSDHSRTEQSSEGHERLAAAIAAENIPLPHGAKWELIEGYWSRFKKAP